MTDRTEVLYNAECPVCSREVNHYRSLSERAGLPVDYAELADPAVPESWGISADEAARRLHVRKEGKLYAGVPAFIVLWREIPRTRWLARLFSLPGVHWLAVKIYDMMLAPVLYRMHRARTRRKSCR
tara:strand:- start:651 stop:1031 length:381 start_codon:yes stop_codon:yes gene_type:complete